MTFKRLNPGGWFRSTATAAILTCLLTACGQKPTASFTVHQPRLPGRQQDMTLTSVSARYGAAEGSKAWHILIQFPLPGAASGRPKYLLYLHVPDPGVQDPASLPLGETAPARGFFVQTVGEGRGRELIVGGFVELRRASETEWTLKLMANGAVGTEIHGTATLRRDDLNVRDYIEAHHPGDVADLLAPPVTTQKAAR